VIRAESDGSLVRVKDVGRVKLGAGDYRRFARRNGAAASIGISQTPGANAVATAAAVRKFMAEAKQQFPAGIDYDIT
jgi:HAE1 family hydrophobic/amphiphilic exporter-1